VVDGGKPGVGSRDEGKHTGRNGRSVIRREDDVGGRASVTRDENFRALYKNACFLSTLVFVYYL